MRRWLRWIVPTVVAVVATAGIAVAPADAHGYRLGDISIGHFWSLPTKAGDSEAGVFGILLNNGKVADRLIGATTSVAARVRFRTKVSGGDAKWPDGLAVEPGRPAVLAPWRTHLWLTGLKHPLKAGTSFPLTLTFKRAGPITIQIVVGRQGMH